MQTLRNDPQKDAQHHVEHHPIVLHEVAQPLWHRQHPLTHRQMGQDVVNQVCRSLGHTPGIARWAHAPPFAGKRHKVVMATIVTAGAGKTVGKDPTFEVFAKRLADVGLWCVVVALAVKLACAGQLKPSLKITVR